MFVNISYFGGEATDELPGTDNGASGFSVASGQALSHLNMSGNINMTSYSILNIGRLEGLAGSWSLEMDGTMKTESLLKTVITSHINEKVETIAVTSPEAIITLAGTTEISGDEVEIKFDDYSPEYNDVISAWADTRVVVTPMGPVSLYVSYKDNNGFKVKRFDGSSDTIEFDWMVSAYRKGYEPEPEEEVVVEENLLGDIPAEEAPQPEEEVVEEEPIIEEEAVVEEEPVVEEVPEPEVIIEEEPIIEEPIEEVVEEEPAEPESPVINQEDDVLTDDGGVQAEMPSGNE